MPIIRQLVEGRKFQLVSSILTSRVCVNCFIQFQQRADQHDPINPFLTISATWETVYANPFLQFRQRIVCREGEA